jgi:hypothetical protein
MKDALRRSEARFRRTALLGVAFGERCLDLMGKDIHGNEVSELMESFIERLAVKQKERREKEKENREREGREKEQEQQLQPQSGLMKSGGGRRRRKEEDGEELLQTIEVCSVFLMFFCYLFFF